MGGEVRLRAIEEPELDQLVRLLWDPEAPGEHQWFGFRMDKARDIERRWREDGLIMKHQSYEFLPIHLRMLIPIFVPNPGSMREEMMECDC